MSIPRTLAVVGAGPDRRKFGNKCVRCGVAAGFTVYPIHPTATVVEGLPAFPSVAAIPVETLDMVSLYVPPSAAITLLDTLEPGRIGQLWLNPGVDTPAVVAAATQRGFTVVAACTIVAAGFSPADFPDE